MPVENAGPPGKGQVASRLPDLGGKGEGWVALQVALLTLVAAAGIRGSTWPSTGGSLRRGLAALSAAAGAGLFIAGCFGLGRQLTPFPMPVEGGTVRRAGAYGLVRHPIYGGVLLLSLAWGLATSPATLPTWTLAAAFFEAKRRREEAWLVEKHPDYEEYRQQVRARFIPFVW
jgi:protein-S-isoprenylcysteine O-methyltransferase Ste14